MHLYDKYIYIYMIIYIHLYGKYPIYRIHTEKERDIYLYDKYPIYRIHREREMCFWNHSACPTIY